MAVDDSCESSHSAPADQEILELRRALNSCSEIAARTKLEMGLLKNFWLNELRAYENLIEVVESGDLCKSSQAAEELARYLDSVSQPILSNPEDKSLQIKALDALLEIRGYICSVDEAVIDAITGFLLKEVAKFSIASEKCLEIADNIIDKLIEICGARFMLPILTGAFGYLDEQFQHPRYLAPLLHGTSAAFLSFQRRQFENIKAALPVILNALEAISRNDNVETLDLTLLFQRTLGVASSIHMILEGKMHDRLRALLALFILQAMTLVSISLGHEPSICIPLVTQLMPLLSYCGLSYLGCITGSDVDKTNRILSEEDEDISEMSCFSLVKHGACLSVIWGHMSNVVSESAKEDLSALKNTLRNNQEKRWQAIGMMKYLFTCNDLSWELKKQGIDFLLGITEDDGASNKFICEPVEYSHYVTSIFSSLQAVEILMMSAPDPVLRKKAYEALKRILADISPSQRLDVLKALITSCHSSSMTAILTNLLREEMHREQKRGQKEISPDEDFTFWKNGILEIVGHILRHQGGPPSVVEDSDAVLSALNLYRYILITESTGKSNKTGALSTTNLRTAYYEWLLPLRTLISAVKADESMSIDYICGLNPVELVLYRCIELVEEQWKCSS
ncbi:unnamed protein product [Rhodiola kirilowii]